jgi:hypothetical protein
LVAIAAGYIALDRGGIIRHLQEGNATTTADNSWEFLFFNRTNHIFYYNTEVTALGLARASFAMFRTFKISERGVSWKDVRAGPELEYPPPIAFV